MTLSREADAEVEIGGKKVTARFYRSTLKTPMGAFKGETWVREDGVVLKSKLVMPFGTVTSELK